jgi:hypothetical protein
MFHSSISFAAAAAACCRPAGVLTAAALCQAVAALQPEGTILVDESLTSGTAYWEASKVKMFQACCENFDSLLLVTCLLFDSVDALCSFMRGCKDACQLNRDQLACVSSTS